MLNDIKRLFYKGFSTTPIDPGSNNPCNTCHWSQRLRILTWGFKVHAYLALGLKTYAYLALGCSQFWISYLCIP